jgi:hypothetical protein
LKKKGSGSTIGVEENFSSPNPNDLSNQEDDDLYGDGFLDEIEENNENNLRKKAK